MKISQKANIASKIKYGTSLYLLWGSGDLTILLPGRPQPCEAEKEMCWSDKGGEFVRYPCFTQALEDHGGSPQVKKVPNLP